MTINASILRPGLLVIVKTRLRNVVDYEHTELEAEHLTEEGAAEASWTTKRIVFDPKEHEAGIKARSKMRSLIRSACIDTGDFGFLCPEVDRDKLERAVAEAKLVEATFNADSKRAVVAINVLIGRVAADDELAIKAISSEVRDLMEAMEEGLARCDVKAIREAATKAKAMGNMLSPEAAGRVQVAVEKAREAASKIAKAGDAAVVEIDRATINRIAEMRSSFLDMDDGTAVAAPTAMPGRTIELFDDEDPNAALKTAATASFPPAQVLGIADESDSRGNEASFTANAFDR